MATFEQSRHGVGRSVSAGSVARASSRGLPRPVGVFETLEMAFGYLVTGPAPLAVKGHLFPDLPDRHIPLHQLRVRLLSPLVSTSTRAAVWSYLVRQARTSSPRQSSWTVGAAGMALPELLRIVGALARSYAGELEDLEAAALGAFLGELRRVDLDDTRDPRLRWRLLIAAYRATRTLRDTTHTTIPDPGAQHGRARTPAGGRVDRLGSSARRGGQPR